MAAEARALVQRYGPVAPTGTLPVAGTASYSGHAAYSTVDANTAATNPELMSRMRMTADFGSKSVTGSFDTFVDASNTPVPGSATITSGTIVQDSFVGAVSSAINVPAGGAPFNGTVIGTFYGPQAKAAFGLMDTAIAGKPAIAIFGAEQ